MKTARPVVAEPLETRTLFLTADPSFGNGLVLTRFVQYNNEFAEHAVVLKSGQLLVQGRSQSIDGTYDVAAFAVYTPAGKLATGFNGNGKLLLPPPVSEEVGDISDVQLLPDGNVLVVGEHALIKLKTNGTVDQSFGKFGLATVPNYVPDEYDDSEQAVQLPNGGIKVGEYSPSTGLLSVATFDSAGQLVTKLRRTIPKDGGEVYVTAAAETIQFELKLRQFRSDLSIESKFGVGGIYDLTPEYVKWANTKKPWTDVYGDDPIKGIPEVGGDYRRAVTSREGFTVHLHVDSTAKGLPSTYDHGYVHTTLTVDVDSLGKHATFYGEIPPAKIYGHAYFLPAASGSFNFQHFGGKIVVADGSSYNYEDKIITSTYLEYATDAIAAGGDKYYIIGTMAISGVSDTSEHFAIARTNPAPYL